jgi:hypothetical protein
MSIIKVLKATIFYCNNLKLFHSVYFDKIISEKDWGDHPSSPRVLDSFDVPYCYYNYIEA